MCVSALSVISLYFDPGVTGVCKLEQFISLVLCVCKRVHVYMTVCVAFSSTTRTALVSRQRSGATSTEPTPSRSRTATRSSSVTLTSSAILCAGVCVCTFVCINQRFILSNPAVCLCVCGYHNRRNFITSVWIQSD